MRGNARQHGQDPGGRRALPGCSRAGRRPGLGAVSQAALRPRHHPLGNSRTGAHEALATDRRPVRVSAQRTRRGLGPPLGRGVPGRATGHAGRRVGARRQAASSTSSSIGSGCRCRGERRYDATAATTSVRPGAGMAEDAVPFGIPRTRPEVAAVRGFLWAGVEREASYLMTRDCPARPGAGRVDRTRGAADSERTSGAGCCTPLSPTCWAELGRSVSWTWCASCGRRGLPPPATAGSATRQARPLLPGPLLAGVAPRGRSRGHPPHLGRATSSETRSVRTLSPSQATPSCVCHSSDCASSPMPSTGRSRRHLRSNGWSAAGVSIATSIAPSGRHTEGAPACSVRMTQRQRNQGGGPKVCGTIPGWSAGRARLTLNQD